MVHDGGTDETIAALCAEARRLHGAGGWAAGFVGNYLVHIHSALVTLVAVLRGLREALAGPPGGVPCGLRDVARTAELHVAAGNGDLCPHNLYNGESSDPSGARGNLHPVGLGSPVIGAEARIAGAIDPECVTPARSVFTIAVHPATVDGMARMLSCEAIMSLMTGSQVGAADAVRPPAPGAVAVVLGSNWRPCGAFSFNLLRASKMVACSARSGPVGVGALRAGSGVAAACATFLVDRLMTCLGETRAAADALPFATGGAPATRPSTSTSGATRRSGTTRACPRRRRPCPPLSPSPPSPPSRAAAPTRARAASSLSRAS